MAAAPEAGLYRIAGDLALEEGNLAAAVHAYESAAQAGDPMAVRAGVLGLVRRGRRDLAESLVAAHGGHAPDDALTLLALVSVPVLAYLLNRTPAGLAVRMVGENPSAAEGQGIDVVAVRVATVVAGSALMGVAGAFDATRATSGTTPRM